MRHWVDINDLVLLYPNNYKFGKHDVPQVLHIASNYKIPGYKFYQAFTPANEMAFIYKRKNFLEHLFLWK